MQPLSQQELRDMRQVLSDVQTTPVEVWRATSVTDPGGGTIDTWSKVHDYNTMFYAGGGIERQLPMGTIETVTNFIFLFDVTCDIHQQDQLKVGNRTFRVEQVGGGTNEIVLGLSVGAMEVT